MNYYNLLGLSFDATQEEIRKAYFESAKKFHPDVTKSLEKKERFMQIQNAYETLINDETRIKYDGLFEKETKKDNSIEINAYYSRPIIPILPEKQLFYLLLDIFSTREIKDDELPTVNLCIVLDKSTSMQGEVLENLKLELISLIRLLKDDDIVSIVTFSDRAETLFSQCKIKDLGNELTKIHTIYASGATEILKGLEEGIKNLSQSENEQAKLLYLITDGHTYGDEERCLDRVREASEDGIIFQAVGVGQDWNDDFLDNLSKIAGGETQFVTTSQELYNLLRVKIKTFGVIYSKSVKISFNLHPNVINNYAFRINPDLSRLEVSPEINLGSLYSGRHLRVIFEFIIDELPFDLTEIRLSNGAIKVETPSKNFLMNRFFYDFRRPVLKQTEKEKVPPIIVSALSSLSLYRLQEKAREDVLNGKFENATTRLHHLATHLISKGNKDLAKTVLREVENLNVTHHFSELGKKKIKYGTRSLLMLPEPLRED
jgi:Ca-activated chloride channel family protein